MFARLSLRLRLVVLPLALLACASCSSFVDVKSALEVTDASGGWYDAGIVEGKNKIVPQVSFRLRKKNDADIGSISLNVVFRHPPAPGDNTEEEWDEVFLQKAEFSDGNQTPILTVRTEKGYTGDPPQSRMDILNHSQFKDVRARIFAKHSSTQWVEIGMIDVQRQLLVR
jgi:hypothetical protein